ncbi:MAG: hypothetical protein JNM79_05755 [Burkholderiales bacterium]|nr:hypothetical protein [Burkholderiales bacterium]
MRSYWTGTPVLTLPIKAKAERMLGVDARSLVLDTSYITDRFDINLSRWRSLPVVGRLLPYAVFVWLCMRAERIHSFCDRGVLPQIRHLQYNPLELFAYRVFRIEHFLWTYGADVRSRHATLMLGDPNCCTDCRQVGAACVCDEATRVRYAHNLVRNATAVFSMGDMIEYVPGSNAETYFWPIDLDADAGAKYRPSFPDGDDSRPLRVVHAPNHRDFKGTKFLEQAVRRLVDSGVPIELVMVHKVPNEEALRIYRTADVIFDQCMIGFHGYFALEAMALGKPVMCFIRKESYLLAPDECPIVRIDTLSIGATLSRFVRERSRLRDLGVRGRRYVERHYSVEAFSRRLEVGLCLSRRLNS